MKPKLEQYDVGVIIGRFQVHTLHDAHRELIQHVCDEHEKVIIFLGLSPLMNTPENPLDFESRRQMIQEAFPDVNVAYVKDMPADGVWSTKLDRLIGDLVTPNQSVCLYGGRDSFIAHYEGGYPTRELIQDRFMSGDAIRKSIARSRTRNNPDFRAGVIWASQSRFPTAYQTVDVAIIRDLTAQRAGTGAAAILLGRKRHETLYRFIGGFSDPRADSLEADVRRETREEAGDIEIGNIRYVGSARVADWRYRSETDCIKTALFLADFQYGRPVPGDDIEEVRWFPLDGDALYGLTDQVVPTHRPLVKMLRARLREETSR